MPIRWPTSKTATPCTRRVSCSTQGRRHDMASSPIPIETLPEVVLGKNPAFPRAEAMAQLAASSRQDRETLLARVLEEPNEPRRYRAVAAIALGRIATSASEEILLRNVVKIEE